MVWTLGTLRDGAELSALDPLKNGDAGRIAYFPASVIAGRPREFNLSQARCALGSPLLAGLSSGNFWE
jgi:hypothetical protein